jgi:acyl-CoA dehydrogenase
MNFNFTDEQLMLKKTIRKISQEVLEPAIKKQGTEKPFPKEFVHQMLKTLQPFGFLNGTIPIEQGGMGLDPLTMGLMLEELPVEIFLNVMVAAGGPKTLAASSNEHLKEKCLPGLLSGDKISATAITEPNVGSNPTGLQTTAYLDGDHYVINGTKIFISNGHIADYVSVVVQLDKSQGSKGMATLLVDREESSFESKVVDTIGDRTNNLGELFFDNVRVPKENLLVSMGGGKDYINYKFDRARASISVFPINIAQRALDHSIKYAKERMQFGKPIGSFQLIQKMLADMKTDIDCARFLTYRALSMLGAGKKCSLEASMAKQFSTEMALRVTSNAIQIHGAYGLTTEFPVEALYRSARMLTIPDGTTQINKLVMGRELTGLKAFV